MPGVLLRSRVAIVTGASSGIGRVCCETLARGGVQIVAVGRDLQRLNDTAARVRAAGGPEPLLLPLDVRREDDMQSMAARTLEAFGRIHILVHSAGILRRAGQPLRAAAQLELADWDEVLDINLRGTFLANRAVLPAMLAAGQGDIVNLSSKSGLVGNAFDAPYCASKFGVMGLSEALADEARHRGVRVQVLSPGRFDTEVLSQIGLPQAGRIPPAQRVADTIAWMLSMPPDVRLLSPVVDAFEPGGTTPWAAGPSKTPGRSPTSSPPIHAKEIRMFFQNRLDGKVIIITGGAGGIGLATAKAAASIGASIVVADLDEARCTTVAAELEAAGAPAIGVPIDVREEAHHARLVQATLTRFGRIDALIACAGILRLRGTPPKVLVDTSAEEFDQVVGINLRGVFLANRAVLPTMIAQRSGMIINLSSVQGLQGRAYDSVYCASKSGVIGLSQAVADEVRTYGVKVQALMPAAVATPMWEQNKPAPMPGDAIAPERIAELIVFMLLQPEDTMLVGPVIAPVGARKRKAAG